MRLGPDEFKAFHEAVHGSPPFPWQQRLLESIVNGRKWPEVLDVPTGAGKTTCIDIALFALALDQQNEADQRWCPRRIVMVVDRRVVVDQAAERGRKILRAMRSSEDAVVREVARRLRSMSCVGEEPFAVFTLRGGMPKDDGWARTPDQPLVIASTVDQVGSRLLMQGYGVSQSMRPVHAGLLANDTLLLLDEVHLSEPFRQTLEQLAELRKPFSRAGIASRFVHVFLSATPGSDVNVSKRFALTEEDQTKDSPLGPRLYAPKPARLIEVDHRDDLEARCVDEALALLARHRTVAVVVNRLKSANAIAQRLAEKVGAEAHVTLLTGRMRPLDRDDVLQQLRPVIGAGRKRNGEGPKRVVVATQCIEAGADFDFDALVTESASLDALRQRFGRVDRLGTYGEAEGVIVHDRSASEDPIYGKAIGETFKWLKEQEREVAKQLKVGRKKKRSKATEGSEPPATEATEAAARVDFGILALAVPEGEDLQKLLAPKPRAPTLLPAYLDLWAQTSPPPSRVPDVSLWLHGPKAGPPDVQVVWRADLTAELLERAWREQRAGHVEKEHLEAAIAIVAAVRPSSLEAISLPFAVARAWLAQETRPDAGDAEGASLGAEEQETADENEEDTQSRRAESDRPALRWYGDDSRVIKASSLRPGDTIVVPASYGGIRNGCFDATATEPVVDRAEQAAFFGRGQTVLRLHPAVLESLALPLPLEEVEAAREALADVAQSAEWPAWKRLWAERLAKGRRSFVVPSDPSWHVLEGGRVSIGDLLAILQTEATFEEGIELTTDGDDSFCAGCAVPLGEHSAHVEMRAREYAERCGFDPRFVEHVALAAWLHDIGKADRRFQIMLREGSEIEYFKDETPWAKSPIPPGAKALRRLAREKSGYPGGGYHHAVQSVAMMERCRSALEACLRKRIGGKEVDLDLVLHLVASHHGECRPFAPVLVDEHPVEVSLEGHRSDAFGTLDFPPTSSAHGLHRLDSPLADRFWGLVAKYGWLELCWLEAIVRLADHRASEEER
ncbi:MAG: type I-U CRISPR-associated helicase/endonuclease Cas3 [Myxococcota bacterium]|nr:type I-U CRISPR-associated helicase/endonuclease Cas3 [Myxococcota bacterium]